jgi:hypothetical protein
VFARAERLLVAVDDQTQAGFWVATPQITVLPADTPANALGAAVHAALAMSRAGVPTPSFRDGSPPLDEPLWRAAGVRSRRAFMSGARLCTVHRHGADVTIHATVNGGTSGEARGWRPADGEPRVLPATSDALALGLALQAALSQAQPWSSDAQ